MPRSLQKAITPEQSAVYEQIAQGRIMAEVIDAAMTMLAASHGLEWPPTPPRGGAHGVSVVPRGDLPDDEATIPLSAVAPVLHVSTLKLRDACTTGWLKARKKVGEDRAQPYWFTSVEAINAYWRLLGKKKVWTTEDFNG